MIFNFFAPYAESFALFNLVRYTTFRAGAAMLTALVISLTLGPMVIQWLRGFQRGGQPIRADGPERHLIEKKGTPTMGGVLMLLAMVLSTLFWADLRNGLVWAVLLVTVSYGLLGFADDWLKVTKRNTKGVSGRMKLLVQGGVGLFAAIWITMLLPGGTATSLALPVFKEAMIPLGFLFPLVGMLVMMGASNAVNLTDGLDGLAIVPAMIAAGVFALIAYLVGNRVFADYLQLHAVPGANELTVFLAALIGAGLGFLWFNAPPAAVFMGDTGSLALGGALTHDVDPQGRMRHLGAEIDVEPALRQRVEIVGKGFPAPGQAFLEDDARDVLHALHQAHQHVALGGPARRKADAAVAHDGGRDAMRRRRRDPTAPGRRAVIVRVNVDEARRDEQALGIDLLIGTAGDLAHRHDAAVLDRDVGLARLAAGAVDHRAAANDQPPLAHRYLHSS